MRLTIARSDAWALGVTALTARVFWGIAIDRPDIRVSGWICALGGALLCLPLLFVAPKLTGTEAPEALLARRAGHLPTALMEALFLPALLLDAAGSAYLTAQLADYATMTHIQPGRLLVPLAAACFLALLCNGAGVGGAARLWLRLLPAFLIAVLLQRLGSYDPRWLTPVFGSGWVSIASGAASAAGCLFKAAILWLIAMPDARVSRAPARLYALPLWSGLAAAALLALRSAMTPALLRPETSRVFQLDSVISNGRASIATQLPMLVIWFAGLLASLSLDLFLSAALLQRVFPRLGGRVAAALAVAAAFSLALAGLAERPQTVHLGQWSLALLGVPFFLVAGTALIRGGREAEAR